MNSQPQKRWPSPLQSVSYLSYTTDEQETGERQGRQLLDMRGSFLFNNPKEDMEMTKAPAECLFIEPTVPQDKWHSVRTGRRVLYALKGLRCFNRHSSALSSYLHEGLPQVGSLLDELAVFFQEGAEEQAEVLDEVLFVVLPVGIGHSDVSVQRQHLAKRQNITSQPHLYLFMLKLQFSCCNQIYRVFSLRTLNLQ